MTVVLTICNCTDMSETPDKMKVAELRTALQERGLDTKVNVNVISVYNFLTKFRPFVFGTGNISLFNQLFYLFLFLGYEASFGCQAAGCFGCREPQR
jgi:hypothetical protein